MHSTQQQPQTLAEAQAAGKAAFAAGQGRTENPLDGSTDATYALRRAWFLGWERAWGRANGRPWGDS